MKGDFSRIQVDLTKHDEVWLRQQGRVFLDSDQNEAELTRLQLRQRELVDLVGPAAAPFPGTGFQIGPGPTPYDLSIGGGPGPAGRIYVNGIACQNDGPTTYLTQPDYKSPPALPLPDPSETGWTLTGNLASARVDHASVQLHDGRVLVVGGQTSTGPLSSAEIYDPASNAWSGTGKLTAPRFGHSATLLIDGRVLVAGGSGPGNLALNSAELYDPATGTWAAAGTMHDARFFHSAVTLLNGHVVVAGGVTVPSTSPASVPASGTLNTVEMYDPVTNSWRQLAPMNARRAHHTATMLPGAVHAAPARAGAPQGLTLESRILVAGGSTDGQALNSSELYDTRTQGWTATTNNMSAAREMHTATVLRNQTILVCGGSNQENPIASVEVFTPGPNSWALATQPMHMARARHTATLLNSGRVLIAGGKAGAVALDSTELFDPNTLAWTVAQPLNEPRFEQTAQLVAGGRVLLAGGLNPGATGFRLPRVMDPGASQGLAGAGGPGGDVGPGGPPGGGAGGDGGAGGGAPPPVSPVLSSAELYEPAASTFAVAYIEVWRRPISPLQDPEILEAALGTDTTLRLRTVAQVKLAPLTPADDPAQLDCAHAELYVPGPGSGRLTTVIPDQIPPADECQLPDASNYLGRENRLYRVEIHDPGEPVGAAPPASLLLAANVLAGQALLRLGMLTADQAQALTQGRWYIVQGAGTAMRQEPVSIVRADVARRLVFLASVVRHAYTTAQGAYLARAFRTVAIKSAASPGDGSLLLPLDQVTAVGQRGSWSLGQPGQQEAVTILDVNTMTGRATLDGQIRLAHAAGSPLVPLAQYKWSRYNAAFAVGVDHIVDNSGSTTTLKVGSLGRDQASMLRKNDLVEVIGDRSDLGAGRGLLCYVHSDPDPEQLQVVLDAQIDPGLAGEDHLILRRWDGTGPLTLDEIDLGDGVHIQFSGSDFRSGDYWWFTSRAVDGSLQRLTQARPNGVTRHRCPLAVLHWIGEQESQAQLQPPLSCVPTFETLTGIDAEDIAYDDSRCRLNASTVQEAIDILCARMQPSWPVITRMSWRNDRPLTLAAFNQGISVTFSEPMHPATVNRDTFLVTLDLPVGSSRQNFQVNGDVRSADGITWTFTPRPVIGVALMQSWMTAASGVFGGSLMQLGGSLMQLSGSLVRLGGSVIQLGRNVRCHVVLKGNAILDARGERPLDGNAFGRVARMGYDVFTDLTLPSGDTIRGGDFESWCFLVTPATAAIVQEPIYPPSGSVFPFNQPPDFVQVTFTKDVQFSTVPANFVVQAPSGKRIPGRVDPYPYSTTAQTASGATFSPQFGFQATAGKLNEFKIRLIGTGPTPILDLDGQPLGGGADYGSSFYLTPPATPRGPIAVPHPQPAGPIDHPLPPPVGPIEHPLPPPIGPIEHPLPPPVGPIVQPAGPIVQPAGPVVQPAGPIVQPAGPIFQPPGPVAQPPMGPMRPGPRLAPPREGEG
jgi:N-acetylneuraminic acid mutarotase